MEKETTDKLYAFVRMLKEKKPFLTVSNTKANHWIDLLNLILGDKLEKTMNKLSIEGQEKRFKTVVETMTLEEFDNRLNESKIKPLHIVGTRVLENNNIEVVYTKLNREEEEDERQT